MFDSPLIGPTGEMASLETRRDAQIGLRAALRTRLIHFACRVAPIIIPRLPRLAVIGLAVLLGTVDCVFMGRRKMRIALANLEVAFGDSISMRAKRKIVRRSMCNWMRVAIDLIWFSHDRERRIRKYVWFDSSYEENAVKHPAVMVTAHFGNWEVLCQAVTLLKNIPLALTYSFAA